MLKINYNQLTKNQIEEIVARILDKIEEGNQDALQAYILGAFLENLGKVLRKETYSRAWDEAQLYDKDLQKAYGAEFQIKSSPAYYNWDEDEEIKKLNKKVSDRKELLKQALKSKAVLVIEETGEQIPKVSMKSPSKETIAITLKTIK